MGIKKENAIKWDSWNDLVLVTNYILGKHSYEMVAVLINEEYKTMKPPGHPFKATEGSNIETRAFKLMAGGYKDKKNWCDVRAKFGRYNVERIGAPWDPETTRELDVLKYAFFSDTGNPYPPVQYIADLLGRSPQEIRDKVEELDGPNFLKKEL